MSEPIPEEEQMQMFPAEDDESMRIGATCRMYESEYPAADDVVVVQVDQVAELGAHVSLQEYAGVKGMILASEYTRRRIRSMNRVIRVGRAEAVVVMRVDTEKGYIDLSKRRVTEDDVKLAFTKFALSRQVHSIMGRVAILTKRTLLELYEMFGWALYRKFGHAYDAFRAIVNGDQTVLARYDIPEDVKNTLITIIKHRMSPQPALIRATVEATCFGAEGIDAIKEALLAGQAVGTADKELKIRLLAPPQYTISCTSLDSAGTIALMETAIKTIEGILVPKGGHVVVADPPRVISDTDDKRLNNEMRVLAMQSAQLSDDEDDEDDE